MSEDLKPLVDALEQLNPAFGFVPEGPGCRAKLEEAAEGIVNMLSHVRMLDSAAAGRVMRGFVMHMKDEQDRCFGVSQRLLKGVAND